MIDAGGLSEWNFGDGKCLAVDFLDFGTDLYSSTAHTVVIAAYVEQASGGEVGGTKRMDSSRRKAIAASRISLKL